METTHLLNDILVPDAERKARLATCKQCKHYKPRLWGIIPGERFARCGVCGCFLKVKASLQGVNCPLGKWEIVRGR